MEKLLNKYYLPSDSMLVNFQKGTKGVDCWFDFKDIDCKEYTAHRALSFEDFDLLASIINEDARNECELNSLENQSPEC